MNTLSKARKFVGRWKKGGTRYDSKQREGLEKYREASGWRNGARVTRR